MTIRISAVESPYLRLIANPLYLMPAAGAM